MIVPRLLEAEKIRAVPPRIWEIRRASAIKPEEMSPAGTRTNRAMIYLPCRNSLCAEAGTWHPINGITYLKVPFHGRCRTCWSHHPDVASSAFLDELDQEWKGQGMALARVPQVGAVATCPSCGNQKLLLIAATDSAYCAHCFLYGTKDEFLRWRHREFCQLGKESEDEGLPRILPMTVLQVNVTDALSVPKQAALPELPPGADEWHRIVKLMLDRLEQRNLEIVGYRSEVEGLRRELDASKRREAELSRTIMERASIPIEERRVLESRLNRAIAQSGSDS